MISHRDVPRTLVENLEFRFDLRKWADGNRERQVELIEACDRDLLFFFNAFCWLYEPRDLKSSDASEDSHEISQKRKKAGATSEGDIPFITWPHQEPVIQAIDEYLGWKDIGLEKSRGEGASWIAVLTFFQRWKFRKFRESYGMVSKDELSVDNPDNPDSLMWKLDWQLTKLPAWMRQDGSWKRNRAQHTLVNQLNGSTIVGYSATGDVASGGRKTAFLMDELAKFPRGPDVEAMASTEPVTESRLIVSTPKGPDGAYYDAMHETSSSIIKLVLDWSENISRNRGIYKVVDGQPVAIDELTNPLAEKYRDPEKWAEIKSNLEKRGFVLEGDIRSPWLDARCLRPKATPKSIAQEYKRDYGGSESRFFVMGVVDRLISETVKQPIFIGKLDHDGEGLHPTFTPHFDGYLSIYSGFDRVRMVPYADDQYVIGSDISTGQGGAMGSNSTASIARRSTGEKVAMMVSPIFSPEDWATLVVAACHFFTDEDGFPAYLIWEDNGPGKQFGNRVIELGFRNFYYRTPLDETKRKKTPKAGWWSGRNTKRTLLGAYGSDLADGRFVNPDEHSLVEMKSYYEYSGGAIEHMKSRNTDDPSGAGENHGDRVIADALANLVVNQMGGRRLKAGKRTPRKKKEAPYGSMAWRMEQQNQRKSDVEEWC